jgi:MFS transporter, OFA family, oxalate/formate antiporter
MQKRTLPFSYGWIILIVGTIGVIMSIPGQTMGVSVFTDFLIEALNISRTGISTTYMIGTILSALIIGRAGKFYDRFGAKITALIAVSALALTLLYLSFIDDIVNMVLSLKILNPDLISFILLTFGFFILRFFGQGVLSMVSRNMVVKWFDKNRGLIVALMGAFTAFGFSLAPKLFNTLIETYDWKGTWRLLALMLFPAFAFIVLVFFKDWKPELLTKPDRSQESTENKIINSDLDIPNEKTLKEAMRTRVFWSYNLAIALMAMFGTAFTFHIVSIFSYAEIGRSSAVSIFIPISFIAVIISFLGSTLTDYINLKIILILELIGIIIASIALIFLSPGIPIIILIVGMGIANGTFSVLLIITWVNLFGKKHLGAISGYAMGWTVAGSAIGPFIFSALRDFSGDYDLAAIISITLAVLIFLISIDIKGSAKT